MSDNFDGQDVLDESGDKIGSIERTYVDDGGEAHLLEVKLGSLLTKHRLVPAGNAQAMDKGIEVPYSKSQIEDSPEISTGDTLEGGPLAEIRAYYAGLDSNGGDQSTAAAVPVDAGTIARDAEQDQRNRPANDFSEIPSEPLEGNIGQVRDLGDVIEVPILEEVLVKKQVVREVLRVRKTQTTETTTVQGDVRHEEVEVIPSDESLVRKSTEDS